LGGNETLDIQRQEGGEESPEIIHTAPVATFSFWWLVCIIGAALVVIAGEVAIKYGGHDEKNTRGVTFTLGVVLTIAGLYSLLVSIGNPITGISSLMAGIGLDPTSGLSWVLLWGMVTIAGAYFWGFVRTALAGGAYWTKLAFGIVTAIVVLMMLVWLGRMGAESVLGEELTQQIVDGAQTSLQDGARGLVREDGRLTLEPIRVFDWGTFIGIVFLGLIGNVMMMLVFKGNKLITIPLGIAGLIFFLVVGGYQAYKLEPVRESFDAVGSGISSISLPDNPFGRGREHTADLSNRYEMLMTVNLNDSVKIVLPRLQRRDCSLRPGIDIDAGWRTANGVIGHQFNFTPFATSNGGFVQTTALDRGAVSALREAGHESVLLYIWRPAC